MKKPLLLVYFLFALNPLPAHEILRKENYDEPKNGIYERRSLSFEESGLDIIQSQTHFTGKGTTAFIFIGDQPVALFIK